MGVLADAVQGVARLCVVCTMHDRKALMTELADGFIASPGGAWHVGGDHGDESPGFIWDITTSRSACSTLVAIMILCWNFCTMRAQRVSSQRRV